MDSFNTPALVLSMASFILILLLRAHRSLFLSSVHSMEEDSVADHDFGPLDVTAATTNIDVVTTAALMHFRLWTTISALDEDLGFWVKPRSTTWFSRFLLEEYDDQRWVELFRMTKTSVFALSHLLSPCIRKKDTKYRLVVPVIVRLACALFKLSHGASMLVCSEMFAVGRSTVSEILREVVQGINVVLRSEISWPNGDSAVAAASTFQDMCGMPGVLGAIDGTHFAISKPKFGSTDYFYFKSGGFSMNCLAVVENSKRFLDLYVGMLGSVNDSRMLRRSTLFQRGQQNSLWDNTLVFDGFKPYLLGDGGFPLLPWLMVPHRQQRGLALAEQLFNRKLSHGRAVVENSFALLKGTFRELQHKSDLHVNFFPDVVMACVLMHNLLLKQSHADVERLLQVLRSEASQQEMEEEPSVENEVLVQAPIDVDVVVGQEKRRQLAAYLSLQRVVPT